jgi:hypothetical protein
LLSLNLSSDLSSSTTTGGFLAIATTRVCFRFETLTKVEVEVPRRSVDGPPRNEVCRDGALFLNDFVAEVAAAHEVVDAAAMADVRVAIAMRCLQLRSDLGAESER